MAIIIKRLSRGDAVPSAILSRGDAVGPKFYYVVRNFYHVVMLEIFSGPEGEGG